MSKQSKCIALTHFINPHLFWFHEIDEPNYGLYGEILDLEAKLELIEKRNISNPEIGTLVAVRYLAWNKLIRARVDVAFKKDLLGGEFIMWAIDYGFPFSTSPMQIFRLPQTLRTLIKRIHVAGLVDTFPAEKRLSYKSRLETYCTEKWCKYACDWVEKQLTEGDTVEVMERFTVKDHVWVDLQVTTNLGEKFSIRDQLIKMQLAIDAGHNINYIHLDTTKFAAWMTNTGSSKFRKNIATSYSGNTVKNKGRSSKEMSAANRKVKEWRERNVKMIRKGEESAAEHAKAPSKEYHEQVADKDGNNKTDFTGADPKDEQIQLTLRHVFRKKASSQEPRKQLSERMQHIMVDRRRSVKLGARGDSGIGDCPSAQTHLCGGSKIGSTKPMDKQNKGKPNTDTAEKVADKEGNNKTEFTSADLKEEQNKWVPWNLFRKKASSQEPRKQLSERMQHIMVDRRGSVKLAARGDSGISDCPSAQTQLGGGSKMGRAKPMDKPNKEQPNTDTAEKESSSYGFDNVRMIPAGFDMRNLQTY